MRDWNDIPANAQTVAVVESCIGYLHQHNPYPPNMKIDRTAFAAARAAYAAAIYHLEQFMAELTEEIELEKVPCNDPGVECPKCRGQGWLWCGEANYPHGTNPTRPGHRVQCDECGGDGRKRDDDLKLEGSECEKNGATTTTET